MNGDGIRPGGTEDDDSTLRDFVRQAGITFPIVVDADDHLHSFEAGVAITPYPLDVVVDEDGTIVYLSREFDLDTLTAIIETLLVDN